MGWLFWYILVWCNLPFGANIFYFAASYYFGQISFTWMQQQIPFGRLQLTILSKYLLLGCSLLFWANTFWLDATYYFLSKYLSVGCSASLPVRWQKWRSPAAAFEGTDAYCAGIFSGEHDGLCRAVSGPVSASHGIVGDGTFRPVAAWEIWPPVRGKMAVVSCQPQPDLLWRKNDKGNKVLVKFSPDCMCRLKNRYLSLHFTWCS